MIKRKYILLILMAIMAGGSYYGYYLYNKPVESIEDKVPDIKLTAIQLLEEFNKDEILANEAFLDKIILVSGIVAKKQEGNLYLETGNPMSSIICEMDDKISLSQINADDAVMVKGVCSGFLMDVVLVRCTLEN